MVAATAFSAGGCASPESKLVGTWRFKDLNVPSGAVQPGQLDSIKKAYQGVTLTLVKDKSFELSLPNAPVAGSWALVGKALQMTPKTIAGLTPDEFKKQQIGALERFNPQLASKMKAQSSALSLEGSVSDDGTTISVATQGGKTGTLIFAK
jgi:hypothetical protein